MADTAKKEATLAGSSGIDMPAGRTDAIPSAVTGQPLRYFTPDPLVDLLQRSMGFGSLTSVADQRPELLFLLVRPASVDASNCVDLFQARRITRIALGHASYRDRKALVDLGAEISPRAKDVRQEIVFSGAASASTSEHVYAPHEALPELIDQLVQGLNVLPSGSSPTMVSAIVGFFCAHVHPFLDGNGRWSRLVAAQAGASVGGPASAVISAAFQACFRRELARIVWPETRRLGLRTYLHMAERFESAVREGLVSSGAQEIASQVLSLLERYSNSRAQFERAVVGAFTNGALAPEMAKVELSLSSKRLNGLMANIDELFRQAGMGSHGGKHIEQLTFLVEQTIGQAKRSVMETV